MYDYKFNSVDVKVTHSFTSAAVVATYSIKRSSDVYALKASIQTAPTVTAAIISYYYQPVVGQGTTGATLIGTITAPVATAIGKVMSKNVKPFNLPEGSELVIAVTQTATAGAGNAYCVFGEDPEVDANSPNVVISA